MECGNDILSKFAKKNHISFFPKCERKLKVLSKPKLTKNNDDNNINLWKVPCSLKEACTQNIHVVVHF